MASQKRSRADLFTIYGGYAAAVVTLATSVGSCQMKQAEIQTKQAEVKLKEAELLEFKNKAAADQIERSGKARKEYLAVINSSDRLAQARVLRFIIATETDQGLKDWAQGELARLEGQIAKETVVAQQTVNDLAAKVVRAPAVDETKIELALRTSELTRLQMAKGDKPIAVLPPGPGPEPRPAATKAECHGRCAPDARKCEQSCNGDRACLKTKCFTQEAKCREECLAGTG